jgi:hypothetical protein
MEGIAFRSIKNTPASHSLSVRSATGISTIKLVLISLPVIEKKGIF